MEDIENKAFDDELNKSEETIEQAPRRFIPVPKPVKKNKSNNVSKDNEDGKDKC